MRTILNMVSLAAAGWAGAAAAADSLCASVKIEIEQSLTLERQAFDAKMTINNGLEGIPLTDVSVTLTFTDEDGAPADYTFSTTATDALFFVQSPTLSGIDSASAGTVAAETSASLDWLIIPASGAAKGGADGTLYNVGATLSYKIQGTTQTLAVSPDSITVKPMPYLALDYFLPGQVYGDDAFTPEVIEPAIPFPLGLRIRNVGSGSAQSVKIDSGQPQIVTNGINLLVGFTLLDSSVQGSEVSPTLLLDYGTIASGASKMGYWRMEVTLSGTFTNFNAEISHSDLLGGQVTSLINETNVCTHLHLKDVLVDLPERDGVVDFLGLDLKVYESEGIDTAVSDVSAGCALGGSGSVRTLTLPASPTNAFVYASVVSPYDSDAMTLKSAVRSDGKVMDDRNVWISKQRVGGTGDWTYSLGLFDAEGAGRSYTLTFVDTSSVNQAPVIQYIPNKSVAAGSKVAFLVVASDDGGSPTLSASSLPVGAAFTPGTSTNKLSRGVFSWTPTTAQGGTYPVTFTASDGTLSSSRTVAIAVSGGTADASSESAPTWWASRGVLRASARTNDYAALNMGQLKHLAYMAWNEMNTLPGGAGFLPVFTNAANNYAAVTAGQLKEAARPFYDRMGMTNSYPWTAGTNAAADYAIANIGQAKHLFSFDPYRDSDADGLPDWWEDLYGLNKNDETDADADKDGDGVSNLQEFLNGTAP